MESAACGIYCTIYTIICYKGPSRECRPSDLFQQLALTLGSLMGREPGLEAINTINCVVYVHVVVRTVVKFLPSSNAYKKHFLAASSV